LNKIRGCRNHGLAVGCATGIADMSLDHFAIDADILDFSEIDFVFSLNPTNKAHDVHYDTRKPSTFLGFLEQANHKATPRVSSRFGQNADGVVCENEVEFRSILQLRLMRR
jgi:hypothetical protein